MSMLHVCEYTNKTHALICVNKWWHVMDDQFTPSSDIQEEVLQPYINSVPWNENVFQNPRQPDGFRVADGVVALLNL